MVNGDNKKKEEKGRFEGRRAPDPPKISDDLFSSRLSCAMRRRKNTGSRWFHRSIARGDLELLHYRPNWKLDRKSEIAIMLLLVLPFGEFAIISLRYTVLPNR